mmetsp:Transcript_73037/g.196870  ORF Transcript_73037/g.196870 Transcript_73037/m.196870 type:complete len:140 (+) Transcript_73037:166-585(+)
MRCCTPRVRTDGPHAADDERRDGEAEDDLEALAQQRVANDPAHDVIKAQADPVAHVIRDVFLGGVVKGVDECHNRDDQHLRTMLSRLKPIQSLMLSAMSFLAEWSKVSMSAITEMINTTTVGANKAEYTTAPPTQELAM